MGGASSTPNTGDYNTIKKNLEDVIKTFQIKGNYALKSDLTKYQPIGPYLLKSDLPSSSTDLSKYALKDDLNSYHAKGESIAVPSGKSITIRDDNHGVSWSSIVDGPRLFGFSGGALGTAVGGDKDALRWNGNGEVFVTGRLTANEASINNNLGVAKRLDVLGDAQFEGIWTNKNAYINGNASVGGGLKIGETHLLQKDGDPWVRLVTDPANEISYGRGLAANNLFAMNDGTILKNLSVGGNAIVDGALNVGSNVLVGGNPVLKIKKFDGNNGSVNGWEYCRGPYVTGTDKNLACLVQRNNLTDTYFDCGTQGGGNNSAYCFSP